MKAEQHATCNNIEGNSVASMESNGSFDIPTPPKHPAQFKNKGTCFAVPDAIEEQPKVIDVQPMRHLPSCPLFRFFASRGNGSTQQHLDESGTDNQKSDGDTIGNTSKIDEHEEISAPSWRSCWPIA